MRSRIHGLTIVIALFALAAGAADRKAIYDESGHGEQQIKSALDQANKEGKRVLIQWGGNWCGWCHLLHDLFQDNKEIANRLATSYVVVLIDTHTNKAMIEKYKPVLEGNGVPYLTILAPDGTVIAHHDTGSLEVGNAHDPAKVLALLNQFAPPAKAESEKRDAESIVQSALGDAKGSGKKVFLAFGAPWCGWCKKLDALMAQPDFSGVFNEYYVTAHVDLQQTPGGQALYQKYCKTPGGIPWFLIMDSSGKVLITADSAKGNIGYPYRDEEIAHFMKMIASTATNADPAKTAQLESAIRNAAKKIGETREP